MTTQTGERARKSGEIRQEIVNLLYQRFHKPLLSFFRRRSSTGDAEDMTQDVFVRIASHPDPEVIARPEAYVFQIAENLRRDAHQRDISRSADQHLTIDSGAEDYRTPVNLIEEINPERVLLGKRAANAAADALASLPERTRDIFLLYRIEGMRQRDIAALLGISVSSVEKHVFKAVATLAKLRAQ